MKHFYFIIIALFFALANIFGQGEGQVLLSGKVTDQEGKVLVGVHVIDRTKSIGTATNLYGKYNLKVDNLDTVLFSFLGFKTFKFAVPSNIEEEYLEFDVRMESDTILLKSAVIYPFPSDADALMKDLLTIEIPDTARKVDLHLEMAPIVVELDMDNYRSGEMHLLSFGTQQIYDALSHEGKMKRKYRQLLEHDRIVKQAEARLTDSLIMRATGLVEKEAVKKLREFCDLQPEFVVNSTDYELYVAIMDCYASLSVQ